MKLAWMKYNRNVVVALMALVTSVSMTGCGGGGNEAPDTGSETPSVTSLQGDEAVQDAPEAAVPMPKEATPEEPKRETPAPKAKAPAPTPKTSSKPASKATGLKPEVAVKAWFTGLSKGPSSVWGALPGSYQKDVNGLVQLFSNSMDTELWNRGFGSIKKLTALLKAKKKILLDPSFLAGAKLNEEEGGKAFDHIVGLLDTLAASDLSSLDKLKSFDGGKFLASTGAQFFQHLEPLADLGSEKSGKQSKFSDIANTQVTLIKNEGGLATLKIEVPNEEPKEKDFVQVEGKWIPKDINPEQWKENLEKSRAGLAQIAPGLKENKAAALKILDGVDDFLGKMEKVETKEELQTEIFTALEPLMQMYMQMQQGMMKPPAAKPQAPPVASPGDKKETKAVEKKAKAAPVKKE